MKILISASVQKNDTVLYSLEKSYKSYHYFKRFVKHNFMFPVFPPSGNFN